MPNMGDGILCASSTAQRIAPYARAAYGAIASPWWRFDALRFPLTCLLISCFALADAKAVCTSQNISVNNTERRMIVCANQETIPASGAPLVLAFHGRGSSAKEMADGTRLHDAWPEAIVVYPEGLSGNPAPYDPQGARRGWQLNPDELKDRDLRFTDAMLDTLNGQYKIDPSRVYATGHSNGARFAGVLWATRAARFAAFAFSAGQADTLIERATPRPVFLSMGRRDDIIPFESQWPSIEYARKLLNTDPAHASEFGFTRSESGPGGLELMTYVHPGGHVWPQVQTRLTVEFFKRHQLPRGGN